MAIVDLTGRTIGRWYVHGLAYNRNKVLYWDCECSCPDRTRRAVFGGDLKRHRDGHGSLSCGCLAREQRIARKTTHNMARHPAYRNWIEMRSRCNNPAKDGYALYGGRGIRVCDAWDAGFQAFWADMGPTWKRGLSIDRIDTDGDYEPSNCRWATAKEQGNNRRTNRIISTPAGKMTVTLAAEKYGLNPITVSARIRYGWAESDLLNPVRSHS